MTRGAEAAPLVWSRWVAAGVVGTGLALGVWLGSPYTQSVCGVAVVISSVIGVVIKELSLDARATRQMLAGSGFCVGAAFGSLATLVAHGVGQLLK